MSIRKNIFQKLSNQAGYDLIQMAIALLVIGVLAAPFLGIYNLNAEKEKETTTEENLSSVNNALQNYRRLYGVYPCPAPMSVLRTSSAYGHEVNHTSPNECRDAAFVAAHAVGSCGLVGTNNVCIEQEADPVRRAALTASGVSTRVVVGAIPFRLLQIDETKTADGYGSKFTYVVTESLTDPSKFNEKNGAISIQDETANSLVSPAGSAAFAVISHGKDKVGGYNLDGLLFRACAGTGKDVQNCNPGFETGIGSNPNAVFNSFYRSDENGASHFDDTTTYFSENTDPLWKRIIGNPDNIQDISERNVGIGYLSTPPSDAQLSIAFTSAAADSLRAYGTGGGGTIFADQICSSSTSTTCFPPSKIGGDTSTAIKCANATDYMVSISYGSANCQPIAGLKIECDSLNYPGRPILAGIDPVTFQPDCRAIPASACPIKVVSECSGPSYPVTLPATARNTATAWLPVTGSACRSIRYTCNSSGSWPGSPSSTKGRCSFVPDSIVSTQTGIPCTGFGWTGTYTRTTKTPLVCTDPDIVTDDHLTACVCTGDTRTGTTSCSSLLGSGYTGTATRTETAVPPTCAVANGPWDTSSCSCGLGTTGDLRWVQDGTCPTGYIPQPPYYLGYGGPEKEQILTAACAWSDTGNKRGSCTCDTTTKTYSAAHICADPICEQADVDHPDIFQITINPIGCTQNAPVLVTNGQCIGRSFKWGGPVGSGHTTSSYPGDAVFVGDSCLCSQVGSTSPTCFSKTDPTKEINTCTCQ